VKNVKNSSMPLACQIEPEPVKQFKIMQISGMLQTYPKRPSKDETQSYNGRDQGLAGSDEPPPWKSSESCFSQFDICSGL
jgi:hypothetical protein